MIYETKENTERLFGRRIENVDGKPMYIPFGYIQETVSPNTYLVYCGDNQATEYFNKELYEAIKPYIVDRDHVEETTWDGKPYKHYFYNIKISDPRNLKINFFSFK